METQRFDGAEKLHSALELRRYKPSDFDQMIRNQRNAGLPGIMTSRFLEARIINDPDSTLVAVIGCEVIASLYLHAETDARISSLVVKSNYRLMGVGKRLLCEAERILKEKGYLVVCLKPSDTSIGFYKKLRYVPIERSEDMSKQL